MSSVSNDPSIAGRTRGPAKIIVWDPFIRLFHWTLVASIAAAVITSLVLPITWLGWHLVSGTAALALILARIVWGLAGPAYARFSGFVTGPRSCLNHFNELRQGVARRHLGHNPLGGVMIIVLMTVILAIGLTGVLALGGALKIGPLAFAVSFTTGRAAWSLHQLLAYGLLGLVLLHIGGAIYESRRTKENLARAMIDGHKEARLGDATLPQRRSHPWRAAGIVATMIAIVATAVIVMTAWPATGVPKDPLENVYAQECGTCHVAYHPSLLATATWNAIMDGLAHHFGENAELETATAQSIRAYLAANAAEHYDTLASHVFLKPDPSDPLRITATPFWARRHASISPQVFSSKAVGSKGQCDACHQDASSGRFNPLSIAIPHGSLQ